VRARIRWPQPDSLFLLHSDAARRPRSGGHSRTSCRLKYAKGSKREREIHTRTQVAPRSVRRVRRLTCDPGEHKLWGGPRKTSVGKYTACQRAHAPIPGRKHRAKDINNEFGAGHFFVQKMQPPPSQNNLNFTLG